ncbi:MAG: ABC transporter ATP-binding protein [Promethearchaeota archaeon]
MVFGCGKENTKLKEPILDLKNVSFIRKKNYILSNINWKINKGENWVILGPNGAGKTTLLKLITGYLLPSRGKIKILDGEVGKINLPEIRKSIAWISKYLEELIQYSDPVIEIVLAGKSASTRLWEVPSDFDIKKALNLLKKLNCLEIAQKPYMNISQGEQMKVLIARALMIEPRLIVFDEPCEGLDIASRENFLKYIQKLFNPIKINEDAQNNNLSSYNHSNLPSIIYVTHRIEEILPIFTHVLFLKKGKIHSLGPINEMLNSESLSDLFEINIEVIKHNNRYFSIIK